MKILLLSALNLIVRVANLAIWAYVILSWIAGTNDTLYRIYRVLSQYIEPVLAPIRKLLMPLTYKIGLDFSPYVLAILVSMISSFIRTVIITL